MFHWITYKVNILKALGVPFKSTNPDTNTNSTSFVDHGIADIQVPSCVIGLILKGLLAYTSWIALKHAWYHKWRYCVARPEESIKVH